MTLEDNDASVPLQSQNAGHNQNHGDAGHVRGDPKITIELSNKEGIELVDYNEHTDEGREDEHTDSDVPDGGYGWVVVLACFFAHFLVGSLERVDGIFFLEFQKQFGHGAQLTSWPIAIASAFRFGFGPVASLVCNRYSVRTACIVGSILIFVGILIDSNAPNFYIMFFTHGVIQGVGRGLIYGPGLFLVGMYFNKRRGMAAGLSSSGVGVGTFVLVPLYQFLFETFGYQGAFMCIGAIVLNMLVCAMLYRPLSLHLKFQKIKQLKNVRDSAIHKADGLLEGKDSKDLLTGDNAEVKENNEMSKHHKKDGCIKSSFKICFPIERYNQGKNNKKKLFHFYLLKNPSFLLCCISIFFFTAAFKSAFVFIPAQIKQLGNSDSDAALALSVSGVCDTIGRISIGFFFDHRLIRPYRVGLYTAFIFVMALVSFMLPRVQEFSSICVVCGAYGFITGGFVAQKSVIIGDILESVSISNSFGLFLLFQGVGTIIGPPISGALRDATGNFNLAFDFGGSLMLSAGCLMIISCLFYWRQTRRSKAGK